MITQSQIKDIKKNQAFKHLPLSFLLNDFRRIESERKNKDTRLNVHIVPIDEIKLFAYDLPHLNKYTNQTRRGNYKAIFNKDKFMGIAYHTKKGGYKLI